MFEWHRFCRHYSSVCDHVMAMHRHDHKFGWFATPPWPKMQPHAQPAEAPHSHNPRRSQRAKSLPASNHIQKVTKDDKSDKFPIISFRFSAVQNLSSWKFMNTILHRVHWSTHLLISTPYLPVWDLCCRRGRRRTPHGQHVDGGVLWQNYAKCLIKWGITWTYYIASFENNRITQLHGSKFQTALTTFRRISL
jgi:hypothetical protein